MALHATMLDIFNFIVLRAWCLLLTPDGYLYLREISSGDSPSCLSTVPLSINSLFLLTFTLIYWHLFFKYKNVEKVFRYIHAFRHNNY